MRHRVFFAVLAAALALWAWGSAVARVETSELNPCALSSLRSGDLLILDAQKGVFLMSAASGRLQQLVSGFGVFEASDMATAFLDGGDAIFVTMNLLRSAKGTERGQLMRYNAAGVPTGAWALPRAPTRISGLAVDAQKKVVYVASVQPPEIYSIDLLRSPRSGLFARLAAVPGAERLSALALDVRRGRLLLADPFLGKVSTLDLSGARGETLLEKLGEVSALAVDKERDRLYIAETVGERVLVSELTGKSKAAKPFAKEGFDEPLGLAVGDAGLWVGDKVAKRVVLLSDSGQRLRTFPLRTTPARAVPALPPR